MIELGLLLMIGLWAGSYIRRRDDKKRIASLEEKLQELQILMYGPKEKK